MVTKVCSVGPNQRRHRGQDASRAAASGGKAAAAADCKVKAKMNEVLRSKRAWYDELLDRFGDPFDPNTWDDDWNDDPLSVLLRR
jgi:hypothetical protein